MTIPLIKSNKEEQAPSHVASFTVFILPFKFCPCTLGEQLSGQPCYKPVSKNNLDWVQRFRYFTKETAEVLFHHAKWLEIDVDHWKNFNYSNEFEYIGKSNNFKVELRPPQIILFDWDSSVDDASVPHTGFLLVEAVFNDAEENQVDFDDLLHFNELFRYWRPRYIIDNNGKNKNIGPDHIDTIIDHLGGFNVYGNAKSDYRGNRHKGALDLYLRRWQRLLEIPVCIDNQSWQLFPNEWSNKAEAWWSAGVDPDKAKGACLDSGWISYADDRAFVWTSVVTEKGVNSLRTMLDPAGLSNDFENPEEFGHLIKLLNVDPPGDSFVKTHQQTRFEKEWAKGRFYTRWWHYGTVYGFNYHSGCMLCPKPEKDFSVPHHFRTLYLDMAIMLLYIRVSLFQFSQKISAHTAEWREQGHRGACKGERLAIKKFEALNEQFAIFTNLYQFPLISNQQQAMEMYVQMREQLDIDQLFKEVEEEIRNTHALLDLRFQAKATCIGGWLAVAAIVLALGALWPLFSKQTIPELMGWYDTLAKVTVIEQPLDKSPSSPKVGKLPDALNIPRANK